MVQVVGVRFERAGKIYYFKVGELTLALGDNVIVESSRGLDFGMVATPVQEVEPKTLGQPLKPVLRLATLADEQRYEENRRLEPEAFVFCQQQIAEMKLPMKLIKAAYSFDGSKLVFYFTSDNRVDFRELVKVLAAHFHSRIELRQVGVRDEARLVGGYSTCGRELCCASFLQSFHPVSIKMAKKQNLALNPAKISGVCGRLMCCLYYEYDENATEQPDKPEPRAADADEPDCDRNCGACSSKPCPRLSDELDLEQSVPVADSDEMLPEQPVKAAEADQIEPKERTEQRNRPRGNRRRGRGGRQKNRGGKAPGKGDAGKGETAEQGGE